MKLQMFMMAIVLTIAATVSGEVYGNVNLADNPIICHTPRVQLALKIGQNHVAFIEQKRGHDFESGRAVASTEINHVRTRLTATGFSKILNFENKRHTIHINDSNNFSQLDDYIVIRNSEGHEVTYPLDCENL